MLGVAQVRWWLHTLLGCLSILLATTAALLAMLATALAALPLIASGFLVSLSRAINKWLDELPYE